MDFDRVVDEFSRHSDVIRPIRPDEMAQLSGLLKVHGEEQVLSAIDEAAKTAKERGEVIARGVKYLAAILERWKRGDKPNVEFKRDIVTDRYAAVMARNN